MILGLSILIASLVTLTSCSKAKSPEGYNYDDVKLSIYSLEYDSDNGSNKFIYEITMSKDTDSSSKLDELMYTGKFNGVNIVDTNLPRRHRNDSLLGRATLGGNLESVSDIELTCPDNRIIHVKNLAKDPDYSKYHIIETSLGNYYMEGLEALSIDGGAALVKIRCGEFGGVNPMSLEYLNQYMRIYDGDGNILPIVNISKNQYDTIAFGILVDCGCYDITELKGQLQNWVITLEDINGDEVAMIGG